MKNDIPLEEFAPPFARDAYSPEDTHRLNPFFTNLDKSVYVPLIFSPEVIGALCSRASRAAEDLRPIFLKEYIKPFLEDSNDAEAKEYGEKLQAFINFLHENPIEKIFSNPRARSFYSKWLAQYGDDSIAQMAGMHVVFSSLSMLAIKHFEDQRIGLAPIEKSTRYVDYSTKIAGQYRYYTDPTLKRMKLEPAYRAAMDGLFDTYATLRPRLTAWLQAKFPEESPNVVEKKAFDTLRGLLPVSTLSQVAFFGNGQAFEYLAARSLKSPLGEVRWAAQETVNELWKVTPSFLRRLREEESRKTAEEYQEYMAGRSKRLASAAETYLAEENQAVQASSEPTVKLVEYDPEGQEKVITGILFTAENNNASWEDVLARVRTMSDAEKREIIKTYLAGRTQRWQKVGRAFENANVRYEITMNIGSWTDLQRHRMLTQQRQMFTTKHGFDTPPEVVEADLSDEYRTAIKNVEEVHEQIAAHDAALAQYAVTRAHRIRFMQWANLRSCFWEMELRTIPEGHPDYRHIEQEKFRLLEKVYPLITEHMRVNLGEYDFARRGQEEKIQQKLKQLEKLSV